MGAWGPLVAQSWVGDVGHTLLPGEKPSSVSPKPSHHEVGDQGQRALLVLGEGTAGACGELWNVFKGDWEEHSSTVAAVRWERLAG